MADDPYEFWYEKWGRQAEQEYWEKMARMFSGEDLPDYEPPASSPSVGE
jgi:hypothetical protein